MKRLISNIIKHGLAPAAFYFLMFCLLTWPLIQNFSTRFLTDDGDGFMNIWNLWWVNTAISQPSIHPTIWHTSMFHWPFGTTLLGQTLNPFNGLLAAALLRFMSLVQAHNIIVVFAFVMSGLTAYWLAYYIARSFWGSLLAGFIFTFSSYHFAHYFGHLNLISMEWIPLFILCWYSLITRPSLWMGIASALALWLVLLCDYYYFFYCVLAGLLIVIWYAASKKDYLFFTRREYASALLAFLPFALILTGPILLPLIRLTRIDPFMDAHNPKHFTMDLLSSFIPGETWRFHSLTEAYWSKLPLGISEASVYAGWAVIILLVYLWVKRRDVDFAGVSEISLWYILAGFFFIMSLGPVLQIGGKIIYNSWMPYTILEIILPFIKLSGVPVRMMAMTTLAVSVISAISLRRMLNSPRGPLFASLIILLLFIEYLPATLPSTSPEYPAYVTALAELPEDGGVLDTAAPTKYLRSYYQTGYNKPMAFGYIARTPSSLAENEKDLNRAIRHGNYTELWDRYQIRYIVTSDVIEYESPFVSVGLVYQDEDVNIYRLDCKCSNGD